MNTFDSCFSFARLGASSAHLLHMLDSSEAGARERKINRRRVMQRVSENKPTQPAYSDINVERFIGQVVYFH